MRATRRGFLSALVASAAALGLTGTTQATDDTAIREARAEGYERGRAVEAARQASRALRESGG